MSKTIKPLETLETISLATVTGGATGGATGRAPTTPSGLSSSDLTTQLSGISDAVKAIGQNQTHQGGGGFGIMAVAAMALSQRQQGPTYVVGGGYGYGGCGFGGCRRWG